MNDLWPSRSQRTHYIWRLGVGQFGVLFGLAMLVTDVWRGRWPQVPIGFTSRFLLDAALEVLVIALVSFVSGTLFGYTMWRFGRWFLDVQE